MLRKTDYKELEAIYNNIASSVYITCISSNTILFMNNHMKKLFGKDLTGAVCWKSIHDKSEGPCKLCSNSNLIDNSNNQPCIWEFYNQKLGKWFEINNLVVPWSNGSYVRMKMLKDISEQKQFELKQKKLNEILEEKVQERTSELEDMNAALKVLLEKRKKDKLEIEERIFSNYELLILPLVDKLKKTLTSKDQKALIDILESSLENIVSPFSKKLSNPLINLTPTEILIADLIKFGKSNKEIAKILNCSIHTISGHRENIRKKLGLKNKKVNLRKFLSSPVNNYIQ